MQRKFISCTVFLLLHYWFGHSLEFQTIGIYSLCNGNHTQDEFTQYANSVNLFVKKDPSIYLSILEPIRGRTSYKSFDVCYDHKKLTSALIELLLSAQFYAINQSDTWQYHHWIRNEWSNFTMTAQRSTMIIRIIAHIPQDMLKTLFDVISIEKNIIITSHSPLITIKEQLNGMVSFFNMKSQYGDLMISVKEKGWKNILVLHNQTNDNFFNSAFKDIIGILKSIDIPCLKIHTVHDEKALRRAFHKEFLRTNQSNDLIVIDVGTPYGIGVYNINESAKYFGKIIEIDMFQSFLKVPPKYIEFYNKRPQLSLFKQFRGRSSVVSDFEALDILSTRENLKKDTQSYQSTLALFKKYRSIMSYLIYSTGALDIDRGWMEKTFWSDKLEDFHARFAYKYGYKSGHELPWNMPKMVTSECFDPTCQEGTEKTFGKLPLWASPWDEENGYFCNPCKQNYVKPSFGEGRCKPCSGYFISNERKTKCIDPLQPVHHRLYNISGIITLTICVVGGILSLLGLIIFIKYRETPIVKLSDFLMSLVQLLAILLYFVSTPFVYFALPTKEKCMARTMSIALFYNSNTSVIFTTSNKLLKAFSANIRSTKFEVLKTHLTQVFIIFINTVFALLLVITLWSSNLPEVQFRIDIKNAQKFLYCSNENENIFVSGLMLLLHLACFVQAFRCRRLPGHLNEAMNIVYASFIVTVSLCVMFPIYFSQKNEEDGELVVVLVLTGNSLILFLFMYAKKMTTIIFKPEKNTKEYFRMRQMEVMQVKATKLRPRPKN